MFFGKVAHQVLRVGLALGLSVFEEVGNDFVGIALGSWVDGWEEEGLLFLVRGGRVGGMSSTVDHRLGGGWVGGWLYLIDEVLLPFGGVPHFDRVGAHQSVKKSIETFVGGLFGAENASESLGFLPSGAKLGGDLDDDVRFG